MSRTPIEVNPCRVEEDGDECLYWMELLIEAGLMPASHLNGLMAEINEIVAMTVQSMIAQEKRNGRWVISPTSR